MSEIASAISARSRLLQPTAVNSILAEVAELRRQGRQLVSLMRGEPDLPTPAHIVEAACRALRDGRTHYPDNRGEPAFREAIAEKLYRENGLTYDASSEVLVTTGATFGLWAALTTLLNEGEEVLLPDPIYDAYTPVIGLAGGRIRPVRARLAGGRYSLTGEDLEAAWNPAVKLLLVNTPWNPTGTVLTRDELASVAAFAARRNLVVLSDEIYEAFTYDGRVHLSPATLSEEIRERTILINSLSKTYAMTGWRVGYAAGPRAIIEAMYLVLQQSSRGPATFVQDAAVAALRGPREPVEAMRAEYERRRALVAERLDGAGGARLIKPEGGLFALLEVRALGRPSDEIRRRLLEDHGVVVVHGSAYGPAGEGTLRISFAAGGETLEDGLARLREGLERLAG